MPRGRHRHSQPLHRLLPPVAVSAVALACAGGSWLIGDPGIADPATVTLRGLAAVAAVAAVIGSVQARRWDRLAGKRVGELRARYASAEWHAEERQAELEGQLEEARELRAKAEFKLRAKLTELARLRSEHADLLRRYANAEADLANALEGRRRLELAAAKPSKAITAGVTDHRNAAGAPTARTYLQALEALRNLGRNADRQQELAERARPVDLLKPASAVVPEPRPGRDRGRNLDGYRDRGQRQDRDGGGKPNGLSSAHGPNSPGSASGAYGGSGTYGASGTSGSGGAKGARNPQSSQGPRSSHGRQSPESGSSGSPRGGAEGQDDEPAGETFDFFGKGAKDTPRRERRTPSMLTPRGDKGPRAAGRGTQDEEGEGTEGGGAAGAAVSGRRAGAAAEAPAAGTYAAEAGASASEATASGKPVSERSVSESSVSDHGASGPGSPASEGDLDITELRSAI